MKPLTNAIAWINCRPKVFVLWVLASVTTSGGPLYAADFRIPLMPAASNVAQQGFARIVNRSDEAGTVQIRAVDDAGVRHGPVTLSLGARATVHFNSGDLEHGNSGKGLSGGVGDGDGDWRLELETNLDIEALAYIRTHNGFLTAMHDVAPKAGERHHVLTFNPASNRNQRSRVRLFNTAGRDARVTVSGRDDRGRSPPEGDVRLTLPAGAGATITAQELEAGGEGLEGRFGDGDGKWQLFIAADNAIEAMSLLESPTGNLTNLSSRSASATFIPLMPAASNVAQQGFARIVNRSDEAGTVQIRAVDDAGVRHGPVTLSLGARATVHFNSGDLEHGNSGKGLSGGVGDGDGDWRLELETNLDIEALAYIRTHNGFLTAMHDVAPKAGERHHVLTFNPASNRNQRSRVRLFNTAGRDARVTVSGRDDRGRSPPEGDVRLTLPAGAGATITAQELEAGGEGLEGRFGDGDGKWQLFITADRPIEVMSLLESPTGDLTNLSSSSQQASSANTAPVAYDISLQTDGGAYVEAQLIGTDVDNDVLRFFLNAPPEGEGYSDAFVDRDSGRLVVTLRDDGGVDTISLSYKVTDGLLFSNAATVTIELSRREDTDSTGLLGTNADEYSRLSVSQLDTSTLPSSIDLRGQFPEPENQGHQNSCVGWAVGYSLKSYQERYEEQWEFVEQSKFSAAWVYNQINGGVDRGSRIVDAMDLIIRRGAATERTMPYREHDFLRQPTSEAIDEAANYKARSQATVRSVDQIKAHLADRIPVVLGITIPGTGFGGVEVYNMRPSGETGGHAVVVVGYDDERYGGAFLIMNSWGFQAHSDGFFWLTYDLLPDVLLGAHVMFDSPNGRPPPDDIPIRPPEDLPNLVVASWRATYDPHAGGSGEWEWRILNDGTADAPSNIDINLILSLDQEADIGDRWLQWEEIPFAIRAGGEAYRSTAEGNALPFTIPSDVAPGRYYMGVWIDDVQEVIEADERDNDSFADDRVRILEEQLPDLVVDSWSASWDDRGDGEFVYTISNDGGSRTTNIEWDINLILSRNADPRSGDVYFLFYEDVGYILDPGDSVFRNGDNPAYFNFFETQGGRDVPAGVYYMSVWVDDQNLELESDESNNVSVGDDRWRITRGSTPVESNRIMSIEDIEGAKSKPFAAFGGQVKADLLRKVWITDSPDGSRRVSFFPPDGPSASKPSLRANHHAAAGDATTRGRKTKVAESGDAVLYPKSWSRAMPNS